MRDEKKQVGSRRFFTGIFLLLSLLAGTFGFRAEATEFGDVVVAMQSLSGGESTHGYVEYIISISNRSPKRRTVALSLPARGYGRGGGLDSLTRTVTVEPGAVARVSLWQPALSINGASALGVTIDGREMQENVPGVSAAHGNGYWRDRPLLLMSQGASKTGLQGEFTAVLTNLVAARTATAMPVKPPPATPKSTPKSPVKPTATSAPPPPPPVVKQQYSPGAEVEGGGTVEGPAVAPAIAQAEPEEGVGSGPVSPDAKPVSAPLFKQISAYSKLEVSFAQAELPIAEWSDSWRSYSRYDCIALTADEFRGLTAPIRDALRDWVGAGGAMLVLGETALPADWGATVVVGAPLATSYSQFGEVMMTGGKELKNLSGDEWAGIWLALHRTLEPWQHSTSAADANRQFPVVDNFVIPLRGLFFLILVFVIVIGPVNFWLLNRFKKRMWMLVTIPACAFIASIGVSGFALLSEGVSGRSRIAGVTVLNEPLHRATTLGVEAFYTPLTPSAGLHFEAGTELTPVVPQYSDDGVARSIDWTTDQHLKQGWVVSRVPAHFMVRKVETRRERLTVIAEPGGQVTVVNGLGAPIRDLTLVDAAGNQHAGQNIAAGARVTLTRGTSPAATRVSGLRMFYQNQQLKVFDIVDYKEFAGITELGPNRYLAVLDGAPFLETNVLKNGTKKAESVVLGILGGDGK